MNHESIRALLKASPFEPFELITSAGQRHLIKHPEFAILLPTRIVVTDPVADTVSVVSLFHLTEALILAPAKKN